MKIGIYGVGLGAMATPAARRLAQLAEEVGIESLWTGEHMVLPAAGPSHRAPTHPFLDPIVALTYLAASTSTIRLGLGVLLLPQRHPVQLAKELASLDVLSEGRLIVGIGIGFMEPEMRALGVDPRTRVKRTLEHLAVMRTLWYDDAPSYSGQWVNFDGLVAYPKPVQSGGLPIVFGGAVSVAIRRAAEHGDGWFGNNLDPDQAAAGRRTVREHLDAIGRDPDSIEVTVSARGMVSPELAARYVDAGIDRLIVRAEGNSLDDVERIITACAPTNLLR